jgi:hypothetical protein
MPVQLRGGREREDGMKSLPVVITSTQCWVPDTSSGLKVATRMVDTDLHIVAKVWPDHQPESQIGRLIVR